MSIVEGDVRVAEKKAWKWPMLRGCSQRLQALREIPYFKRNTHAIFFDMSLSLIEIIILNLDIQISWLDSFRNLFRF